MGEMNRLSETLKERGEVLQAAYEQSKVADEMKTNFLYNMSDQMIVPVSVILQSVKTLSDNASGLTEEEINRVVESIQSRGEAVTALLNQLISESEKIMENG
jgi:signal transduction histidine kinase